LEQLAQPLEEHVSLRDVSYTSAARSSHHEHRVVAVGRSASELCERLRHYLRGETSEELVSGRATEPATRLVFVLSGQGPQWSGLGRELMAREPAFREALLRCDEALRSELGTSVLGELERADASSRLDQTELAQPALFALQVALGALYQSWGIEPTAVVGH